MNSRRRSFMPWLPSRATALVAAALVAGGCDFDIENPNAPDAQRAFEDPAGLGQLLGGSVRTWVATRGDYLIMPLNMMADNYTASWNNAAIRYYSSVGSDCPSRCGWNNSATAPEARASCSEPAHPPPGTVAGRHGPRGARTLRAKREA